MNPVRMRIPISITERNGPVKTVFNAIPLMGTGSTCQRLPQPRLSEIVTHPQPFVRVNVTMSDKAVA